METTTFPREMFPAFSGHDRVYLNTGTSGPPPHPVLAAMREADDALYGPAYLEGPALMARQRDTYARAREAAEQEREEEREEEGEAG